MKRWGSFLLIMATIQLYAQDESDKMQEALIMENRDSTVIQELEESPDLSLLDDIGQEANQKQKVSIDNAPVLEMSDEVFTEDSQESVDEGFVEEKDDVLADGLKSSLPEEDVEPEQAEIIEVVDQGGVNTPAVGKTVDFEVGNQESTAQEPLDDEGKIAESSLNQKSAVASLSPGWEQAQKPGNYQKKAQIFKQAGDIYDKIRAVEPSILQIRESFFSQKTALNTSIAEFFYEVGATQAEIAQQIDNFIQKFDEEELEDDELLEEERELVLELNQNKSDLNVLKQNITSLADVSASLDSGLVQLDSLLSKVQAYEDSGWQLYQQIDEIFDDVQAADLLAQMQVIQENAEAFIAYTQGAFSQFFSSSTSMINTQMVQIKSMLTSLQDRGVAIAKEEEQFDADEAASQEADVQAIAAEDAARQEKEASSWQSKVQKYFSTSWQWVKDAALLMYNKLFGVSAESLPTQESINQTQSPSDPANAQAAGIEPVVTAQEEVVKPKTERTDASKVTLPSSIQVQPLPEPPVEIIATGAQ